MRDSASCERRLLALTVSFEPEDQANAHLRQRPIDWYLVIGDLIGDRLSKIPGFVWLMISGAVGKGLMSLMHGDGETVRTTTTTVKEKISAGATGAKTKEEKKKQ